MLYDNAQLLPLYARRGRCVWRRGFADAASASADWIMREMHHAAGRFTQARSMRIPSASRAATTSGSATRLLGLLDHDEFAAAELRFGLDRAPNFEGHDWHLQIAASIDDIAERLGIERSEADRRIERARSKLLAARSLRVRPALDDKILTAWNALAIAGAARSARWLDARPLFAEAERALAFLHANIWRDGRLYACYAGGSAKFPAYLDDHALLLDALLDHVAHPLDARYLDWATALADALLEHFEDKNDGGFFFTAHDAERLPQRPKPFIDESLPAGNGVAARALLKLGHLLGETRYIDAAERTLRAAWATLTEYPHACAACCSRSAISCVPARTS